MGSLNPGVLLQDMCKNGSIDKKCFTEELHALSSILKIQRIRLAGLEAQLDKMSQGSSFD